MPIVKISKDELEVKSFQPLEPGWYKARIKAIELKQSKKGDSWVYHITWFLPNNGAREIKDWIAANFTSKMTPFLEAVWEMPYEEFPQEIELPDPKKLEGFEMQLKLGIEPNEKGNLFNSVEEYLSMKGDPNEIPNETPF